MSDAYAVLTRRTLTLFVLQAALLAILFYPLLKLQVFQQSRYKTLSDNNRIMLRVVQCQRGQIFDRNGQPLAVNENTFRLVGAPHNQRELGVFLKRLSPFMEITPDERKRLFKRLAQSPSYLTPLVIKSKLTWDQVALLSLQKENLEGLSVEPGFRRSYPLGTMAAHLLGYIAPPTPEEETALGLKRHLYMTIGKQGIEHILEKDLHGTEGSDLLELDARRRLVRSESVLAPKAGKDVRLSLDARLQQFACQRVQKFHSASVVVLNAQTGEILAFVSHPGFDPHDFEEGISHDTWNALRDNPYKPLLNKPLQGLYAPGSTLKSVVLLEALQRKLIKPESTIQCNGVMHVGKHPFHCWMHKRGGHGTVGVQDALVRSCDLYMYHVAKLLGPKAMKQAFNNFGLGQGALPEFKGSRLGLVPDPAWKRKTRRGGWHPGDTVQMAIGQGFMLATPLELAVMIARTASGRQVTPSFLLGGNPDAPFLSYDSQHQDITRKALFDVVNKPGGTAFRWRLNADGCKMAGKTGTSQVCRISLAERAAGVKKNAERPWLQRDHALYVGYTVYDKKAGKTPLAIAVVVDHGGGGGAVAAPVARDILEMAEKII